MRTASRGLLRTLFGVVGAGVLGTGLLISTAQTAGATPPAAFTANNVTGANHHVVGDLSGTPTSTPATGAYAPCFNGKPTAVDCNIYPNKNAVWLNSGPGTLAAGTYFFAVLVPGGQQTPNDDSAKNLSYNSSFTTGGTWTNREFTVSATGAVTYTGTHGFDTTDNRLQLMPYATTTNNGGEYDMAICTVPSSPTSGSGAPGVTPSQCKYDNFKVRVATPTKATPTLTTTAGTPVTLGMAIHDTATLSGGRTTPTGTITFALFKTSCTAPVATFTTTGVSVSGTGTYQSTSFTPTSAGTYLWAASYSGDTHNNPATSPCGAADESVVVSPPKTTTKATPKLTTTAGVSAVLGTPIHDTATLSGGRTPTGTITFHVYGTTMCKEAVATFTTPGVAVTGTGKYTSATALPTVAGTYYWTASYSGDTHNSPVTSPCGARDESVLVKTSQSGTPTPILTTQASGPVTVGDAIHDTATLSGGQTPTGTISFKLYSTTTCKTLVTTLSALAPVTGDGAYRSATFVPATAGTYYWTASYSGDTFNNPATSPCGAATESSTVTRVTPKLTTTAGSEVTLGTAIHDTATLSGGHTPTGTITFGLFSTASCDTAVATFSTSGATVTGNSNYTSASFTPTKAGTYYWTARYSGDTNNGAVTSPCGATHESVTVMTKPSTPKVHLVVVKSSTPSSGSKVAPTTKVTYTLTLSDTGTKTATDVTMTDTVPTGTTYVTASATCAGGATCKVTESGGKITWTGIDVPAGGSVKVTFQVTVNSTDSNGEVITNFAVFTNEGTPTCTTPTCKTNNVTLIVQVTTTHHTPSPPSRITAATTVHTGEPWAGSLWAELLILSIGIALIGRGGWMRRRQRMETRR